MGWMTKVKSGQVDEVHDQDDLSPDEVRSDEEHDEGKLKQVIEDEVTSNASGSLNVIGIGGEKI
jgi:hypothetical protein